MNRILQAAREALIIATGEVDPGQSGVHVTDVLNTIQDGLVDGGKPDLVFEKVNELLRQ